VKGGGTEDKILRGKNSRVEGPNDRQAYGKYESIFRRGGDHKARVVFPRSKKKIPKEERSGSESQAERGDTQGSSWVIISVNKEGRRENGY